MNSFFSMISRMKYINRWGLMNNVRNENISEHSLEVAIIAHGLATIGNVRLGKDLNADRAAVLGIFHDCTEIITGDMPTPIKYYNNEITEAYKHIESVAGRELLSLLPKDLQGEYEPLLCGESDDYLCGLVKAADKLSAYIKCIEELRMGNEEFSSAMKSTLCAISSLALPEVTIFMEEFIPAYSLALDDQRRGDGHEQDV